MDDNTKCVICGNTNISVSEKQVLINNEWTDICSSCFTKRSNSRFTDYSDGHILCMMRGCPNDSNEFSEYCNPHYEEKYGANDDIEEEGYSVRELIGFWLMIFVIFFIAGYIILLGTGIIK